MTGWWFYRNFLLYGEWFATEIHLNLAGRGHLSLLEIWQLRAEIQRAYWATFGWGQIRLPEWVYQILRGGVGVGLVGLLIGLLRSLAGRSPNWSRLDLQRLLFLWAWVAINSGLYLRWLMEVGSVSHTRLMFPAIAAISLILALGWLSWLPKIVQAWLTGGLVVGLLCLNLYSLTLLQRAFTPNQQMLAEAAPLNLQLDPLHLQRGRLFVIDSATTPPECRPLHASPQRGACLATTGDTVGVYAEWQVSHDSPTNYSLAIVLHAPTGQVLARRETYPGLGLRPTRYLNTADTFADIYPLQITADITQPLVAYATINLFEFDSPTRAGLPAFDEAGNSVTPIVGRIKLVPQVWPTPQPSQPLTVNFADQIALIGYDWDRSDGRFTLYWQALRSPQRDYTAFIHLLDAAETIVSQADAPPTQGRYPTSWWSAGETVADGRTLSLSTSVVAVRVGLYDPKSGERLLIVGEHQPESGVVLPMVEGD